MRPIELNDINQFVNENIGDFHKARLRRIADLSLQTLLLRKNPYLFRAKNINLAQDLIENLLTAHMSSSEEELFGQFLEKLAIFIASVTRDGKKSLRNGIDLEFMADNIYYLIQIKSGTNWGNSSQTSRLAQYFTIAKNEILSEGHDKVKAILGICYGKQPTSIWKHVAEKVTGQRFWELISGRSDLYTEIIEPLGYEAKRHTDDFEAERGRISNRLVKELLDNFCSDGQIDWHKIVEFNSKNIN